MPSISTIQEPEDKALFSDPHSQDPIRFYSSETVHLSVHNSMLLEGTFLSALIIVFGNRSPNNSSANESALRDQTSYIIGPRFPNQLNKHNHLHPTASVNA